VIPAIAEFPRNHFAEMPETKNDFPNALIAKQRELMRQKRFARDWQENFGNFFRERQKARGHSAGKNRDWNFRNSGAHDTSSLVPSKSKRNRTSFKPA
jgi:hypothetical protein